MSGHCWHGQGTRFSTAMAFGNTHTEPVRCCWCNAQATKTSKETEVPIEGHGPHARRVEMVVTYDVDAPCGAVDFTIGDEP